MPIRRRFEDMTSAELRDLRPDLPSAVAILPVAAIEQHGEHLPLGTDAMIADAMIERALTRLPPDLVATALPVQRLGASDEHLSFSGTLSLDWRTGVETILRIGEGLARAGLRRLVVVSSHGGNTQVVELAALELRRRHALLCATCSWARFGLPEGLVPAAEAAVGIHGGAIETALMLAFRPDLVRLDRIGDQPSLQTRLGETARHLRAHGRLGFGWLAEDLNPVGTVGDARLASAEMGEAIADHQARAFAEFVADVAAFDLADIIVQLP
ncbi:creatininase family protein [Aureimonas sp. AU12]|uniref:creatininase family protein n=1 Tax=Aureimonas sp. AU12 TaxID=1638161 RepID=UPI0007835B5B|nr:creatininase family protein [Aureimonas sp. AU12]